MFKEDTKFAEAEQAFNSAVDNVRIAAAMALPAKEYKKYAAELVKAMSEMRREGSL